MLGDIVTVSVNLFPANKIQSAISIKITRGIFKWETMIALVLDRPSSDSVALENKLNLLRKQQVGKTIYTTCFVQLLLPLIDHSFSAQLL